MALKDSKMFDLGYGNLLAGIQRGQDKADRARERAEDREFTREQKKQDQEFSKSERIEGQEFAKNEAELNRTQETSVVGQKGDITSRQIIEKAEQQKILNQQIGNIDISKIRTQAQFNKVMQDAKMKFQGKEGDKNRTLKSQLLDTEITARETQWRAQLNSTENLATEARQHEKWLAEFKQTGNEKLLRERFTFDASESALGRESSALALDKKLSASALSDQLRIKSNEAINSANIIATAAESVLKRAHDKGMSKQEAQQRADNYKLKLKDDFDFYKKQGTLGLELARIGKEQEADKTYSFDPSFTNKLYEETGLMGFDENEILADFRGDAEDPKKPNIFSGLATNVQQVMQTSSDNPQRQEVLNALIKAQERFSDPRFYDSGADRTMGHSNEAFSNLKGIQNLMQLMGEKGIQSIKQIDPNANDSGYSENMLGPVMPTINAAGSATYNATQDVINSLIQNYQENKKNKTIYPDMLIGS